MIVLDEWYEPKHKRSCAIIRCSKCGYQWEFKFHEYHYPTIPTTTCPACKRRKEKMWEDRIANYNNHIESLTCETRR